MRRWMIFSYGIVCYGVFLATFLYGIGFLGNFLVPHSIDSAPIDPFRKAIAINLSLLGIFALQHSLMARKWFKRNWVRVIPEQAERSTYVLFSSLVLMLLFWQWRPLGGVVWAVDDTLGRIVLHGLFAGGWALVLLASFSINHFDLFGLRQVYLHFTKQEYEPVGFVTPGAYRYIRHPLYLGWLLAFWAAPTMTIAHLLFAVTATVYIRVATQLEERDLLEVHGPDYARYRRQVPAFLPWPGRAAQASRLSSESSQPWGRRPRLSHEPSQP